MAVTELCEKAAMHDWSAASYYLSDIKAVSLKPDASGVLCLDERMHMSHKCWVLTTALQWPQSVLSSVLGVVEHRAALVQSGC